jgi:hypothetical protein
MELLREKRKLAGELHGQKTKEEKFHEGHSTVGE